MAEYELMYIIDSDVDGEKSEELAARFKSAVASEGGEVIDLKEWGKRRLAYEIKDKTEGRYMLMTFRGDVRVTRELERVLKITDEVLRYIVIRK